MFRTDHGRAVHGGGGIAPDLPVAAAPKSPPWWSVAADSGYHHSVADSVALTLHSDTAALAEWLANPSEWEARLLPPFLDRVRALSSCSQATRTSGLP